MVLLWPRFPVGIALIEPTRGDDERMAGKTPVGGEQLETFLLSLDEQQLVEGSL